MTKERPRLEFIQYMIENQLDDILIDLYSNSVYKNDISPRGINSLLTFIIDLINNDYKVINKKILKENFVKGIVSSIKPSTFKFIAEWPTYRKEEGLEIAQVHHLCNIKIIKFFAEVNGLSEEIVKSDFLVNLKGSFGYINSADYKHIVSIIQVLVAGAKGSMNGEEVANHISSDYFSNFENIKFISLYNLLHPSCGKEVILEILILLSSLCRKSPSVYTSIHQLNIYHALKQLFDTTESTIKSRVCNLIGNMCRHSDYFYDHIKSNSLAENLIQCCYDPDKSTRKFACFAIGNAAFINDKLYQDFRPSIKVLVDLLEDEEDNTRANSAGALGNFVRCGDILCQDIIKFKAHEALLRLAESEDHPNPQIQTIKVALFALGNFCYHQSIKNELERIGFRSRIDNIKIKYAGEQQLVEHIDRIRKKLN